MKGIFDQLNLRPFERRLIVIGMIIVFVAVNAWGVWPQFKEWGVVNTDIGRLNQTLSDYQTKVKTLPELIKKENGLKKGDDSMVQADAGSIGVILMRVAQNKVRDNGLIANGYQPGAAHKIDQYFEEQTLLIPYSNSGDTNLLNFLESVGAETMVRVRDLNIKPDAGQTRLMGSVNLAATYQSQTGLPPRAPAAPGR